MRYREGLVWLKDEKVYGRIVGGLGAYFTTIEYTAGGIEREVLVENDDFEILDIEDEYEYDD